ncbi:Orf y [Tanacetum coccineum]|uniref:TPA: Orf y n=1 Tax=Tanacetum coccineum TaxID=301880 RepID=A0ABQ4WXI2_9ASTR
MPLYVLAIPILIITQNNQERKYGMRKSRTYKGKPHNSHVKPFKRKYKDDRGRVKKCKCFICGKEGHFAKDCRSKQGNIARSAVYQELDLDENFVSADFDDSSVYSISEGEGDTHQSISVMVQDTPVEETVFMAIEEDDESDDDLEEEDNQFGHHAFMFHPGPPTKIAEMVQSVGSWKPNKELPVKSKECEHEWNENTVTNYTICYFCGILTTDMSRLNCPKCQLTTCALCARNYLGKTVNVKRKQPQKQEEEKDFNSNEVKLLKELLKEKTEQVQQMIRDQAKEYYENKAAMQKKEEIWQSKESLLVRDLTDALKIIDQLRIEKESLEEHKRLGEQKDEEIRKLKAQLQKKKEEAEVQFSKEEFPPLGSTHVAKPCVETEVHYSGNATTSPKVRKVTNQLYNVKVEFDIPNCTAFGTTAIIDTGASAWILKKLASVICITIPLLSSYQKPYMESGCAGTNALVVLRDTRWEDSLQIIVTMEVDLSVGTQLVYTFPDMILSVNDFYNHVEVAIQTHGYDTWQGVKVNLLDNNGFNGRLSNDSSYMDSK